VLIVGEILPPKDARWPPVSDRQFQIPGAEEFLQIGIEEIHVLHVALQFGVCPWLEQKVGIGT
jgi:hypothetical protein